MFDFKCCRFFIYHNGCGTIGVPASENIELTFAFNFMK